MVQDMTAGKPWKLILFFSLPILIGNLFQQLYSMVDAMIVGQMISMNALAAVGSTGAIFFLVVGAVIGLTTGFSIVTAQRFGSKDEEGVRRSVAMSVMLCVIFAVVLTILSVVTTKPLLQLMNTPEEIFQDAYTYIVLIYGGLGATFYYNMLANILRALGDGKTPLYFLMISSVLNVILDLLLIGPLDMGVAGAGIATVISQLLSALCCQVYMMKKFAILRLNRVHFQWHRKTAYAHLKVGVPMAVQFAITAVGVMVMQGALNKFGPVAIAGFTAANKVEMLVTQPFASLGITMATFCGQNKGAMKIERIQEGMRSCLFMGLATVVIAAALNVFCGEAFTRLFITEEQNLAVALVYAQKYLNIIAIFYPVLAVLYIFRNGLQGMGEALMPVMGGAMELLARFFISLTLPAYMGYMGICLASPIAWIAADIPLLVGYYTVMYKHKKIHNHLVRSKT